MLLEIETKPYFMYRHSRNKNNAMQIRKIHPSELSWANAQYSSIRFSLSSESDFTVVAEIDGAKVGLGRLVQVEKDAAELGGLFVLPEHRGHSIAANLVEFLLKNNTYPTLFCVPFTHLEMFYRRFGFLPTDPTMFVPEKITKKLQWCAGTYESDVVLLRRG